MTLDEALAKARREIGAIIEHRLVLDEILVRDQGATDEEAEDFVAYCRSKYDAFLEKTLVDIEAWLRRDGKALQ